MTADSPPPDTPDRIQRLLDERGLERVRRDPAAIVGLWIKAVNSDLDAREASLSTDNRVGLAYQAGLQAVHAYLDAHGYRVRSGRSQIYVFVGTGLIGTLAWAALAARLTDKYWR